MGTSFLSISLFFSKTFNWTQGKQFRQKCRDKIFQDSEFQLLKIQKTLFYFEKENFYQGSFSGNSRIVFDHTAWSFWQTSNILATNPEKKCRINFFWREKLKDFFKTCRKNIWKTAKFFSPKVPEITDQVTKAITSLFKKSYILTKSSEKLASVYDNTAERFPKNRNLLLRSKILCEIESFLKKNFFSRTVLLKMWYVIFWSLSKLFPSNSGSFLPEVRSFYFLKLRKKVGRAGFLSNCVFFRKTFKWTQGKQFWQTCRKTIQNSEWNFAENPETNYFLK